ncbi:MAG: type II methionyl aminopeptidase [Candidatus Nanoarchaeia archaeon]
MELSKKAGKVVAEALEYGRTLIKEGKKYVEVADAVEEKILKSGAKLAFPCNISINNSASHYAPAFNDVGVFKDGDLVKLDVGAHFDGNIADGAITISIGKNNENEKLIDAASAALDAAVALAKPGVAVSDIGRAISNAIESFGFKPIRNLSGHQVKQFDLHAGISIPNFDNKSNIKLEDGMVIALEPFATNGSGYVSEGSTREIYMLQKPGNIRTNREILEYIINEYEGLPFAKRWLIRKFGAVKTNLAMKEMLAKGILHEFPVLNDVAGSKVAQAEHTVIVANKPAITTKI